MPHIKKEMLRTIRSANDALDVVDSQIIAGAETLAALATGLDLSSDDLATIDHLYPELQNVILHAIKGASTAGRPVYLSWRHGAIQRVEVTAPPPSGPADGAVDIHIESQYYDDGLGSTFPAS